MNSPVVVSTSLFVLSATMMMFVSSYRRSLVIAKPLVRRMAATTTPTIRTQAAAPAATTPSQMVPPPTGSTLAVDSKTCGTEADCDACGEKANDMLGSVKAYDRHVILCVPANSEATWENDIERQTSSFPYTLIKYIDDIKKANKAAAAASIPADATGAVTVTDPVPAPVALKALKLKLTAMVDVEDVVHSEGESKVLVYPDNLLFALRNDQLQSFASFVSQPLPLSAAPGVNEFAHSLPPWKKLVLVCVHNARDKRCGRAGPQVISELNRLLTESPTSEGTATSTTGTVSGAVQPSDVAVRGSSHIGGHVYAGTMIVYPEGRWYGRITKSNSAELLGHVLAGTAYSKCERGVTSSKVLQW